MSTLEIVRPGRTEVLTWDEGNPTEVADVRERFTTEMGIGGLAFKTLSPGKGQQITEFDPDAREITITSPLVGG